MRHVPHAWQPQVCGCQQGDAHHQLFRSPGHRRPFGVVEDNRVGKEGTNIENIDEN